MITSHRDRRAFQNYGYFSRSFLFCQMKSSNLGKRLFAQDNAQARPIRLPRQGCGALILGSASAPVLPPKEPQTIQFHEDDMSEDHILGIHARA
jgi:hypothetical protein